MNVANAVRKLNDYEEVGLIGYPCDGEYIAVLGANRRQDMLQTDGNVFTLGSDV